MRALLGASIALAIIIAPDAMALPDPASTPARHLECVPVARALSGIQIFGNAHTWWNQAEGAYARGKEPKRGAVLSFKSHGSMVLGHVATVSKIVDDRTILITHSNWSPINGRRGQIERDVKVIDVSEAGDWTRVRVWYAPMQDLGISSWPVNGFIYPQGKAPMSLAGLGAAPVAATSLPEIKATGRLDYLGKMLRKLAKG